MSNTSKAMSDAVACLPDSMTKADMIAFFLGIMAIYDYSDREENLILKIMMDVPLGVAPVKAKPRPVETEAEAKQAAADFMGKFMQRD